MAFGRSVSVNLVQYRKALELAGVEEEAKEMIEVFRKYGAGDSASFYVGPRENDGVIFFLYDGKRVGSDVEGFLRISKRGDIYDGVNGKKVLTTSRRSAEIFIRGIFGSAEDYNFFEDINFGLAVWDARGCYMKDVEEPCNFDKLLELKDAREEQIKKYHNHLDFLDEMIEWGKGGEAKKYQLNPTEIEDRLRSLRISRYFTRRDDKELAVRTGSLGNLRLILINVLTYSKTALFYAIVNGYSICDLDTPFVNMTGEKGKKNQDSNYYYQCLLKHPKITGAMRFKIKVSDYPKP